jgi:uncharacterized protein (DUF1778 family)
MTAAEKRVLQAAAKVKNKSLAVFVLQSAMMRAVDSLADRREFKLSAKAWTAFVQALDAPPRDHPRLTRLFREPSIFDRSKS